jgi:hypothetical protein
MFRFCRPSALPGDREKPLPMRKGFCLKQRPITFCNFAEGPAATGARRPILVTEIVEFFLGVSVTTEETK